uniref:Uncharacterized protein n=1 Tax=Megaviridae environmental sample TaxID=1737588 RepID=A0A5J6VK60_9VIRU|nr:MAG: hypothetical protein [Megaviridae environmental sample]
MKTTREKKIDDFLLQIIPQQEWNNTFYKNLFKLKKQYNDELEDYNFVKNIDDYKRLKLGGYIRYFNLDDNFRWGGILVKKYKSNEFHLMVIKNINNKISIVSFENNIIFYKNHNTLADKNRKLFLSYLDKYDK